MIHTKIFKTAIYGNLVEFIISDNREEILDYIYTSREGNLSKEEINELVDTTTYATTYNDISYCIDGEAFSCCTVVLNFHLKGFAMTYGTLVHELYHVRSMIMKRIGQKPDLKNDEFEAYFMGYLMDEFMQFYYECKKIAAEEGKQLPIKLDTYNI